MKSMIYLLAGMLAPATVMAQTVIMFTNGSDKYNAKITVKCDGDNCGGEARVQLLEKERNRSVQLLGSDDLILRLDGNRPDGPKKGTAAEGEHPLVFDDFNFDGEEDVAIRNGSKSSAGGPSYDVYLYHAGKKAFVQDKHLTRLASENLGMFETDRRRKQLTVYQKEGCCKHTIITYGLMAGKGLTRVMEVMEDADAAGDMVTVTTSQLVNGRMKKSVKQYKANEYQRESRED